MRLKLIDPRGLWAVYEDGKTGDDWTFATWEGKARAEEWMKSPERRIADLERQLVEAQATIARNNLRIGGLELRGDPNHVADLTRRKNEYWNRCENLQDELDEAQATIAALQWTKITPDNLPKVGDEVGKWTPSGYFHTAQLSSEWRIEAQLEVKRWTYRRSLSPPAQDSATEAERASEQRTTGPKQ